MSAAVKLRDDVSADALRVIARVSKRNLKPFGVTKCIEELAGAENFMEFGSDYNWLCGFVHHNLGARVVAKALRRNSSKPS